MWRLACGAVLTGVDQAELIDVLSCTQMERKWCIIVCIDSLFVNVQV